MRTSDSFGDSHCVRKLIHPPPHVSFIGMLMNKAARVARSYKRSSLTKRIRNRSLSVRSKAASSSSIEFAKYHGLGNDFVLVDNRHSHDPLIAPADAITLCDRSFGIGADGVILATPPFGASAHDDSYGMRIFNADGSEAEMCGNGIRCLARFINDPDQSQPSVSTLAGRMKPHVLPDGRVTVDMGSPVLNPPDIPCTLPGSPAVRAQLTDEQNSSNSWLCTAVGMGNPHGVIFSDSTGALISDVDSLALETIGPPVENHSAFPSRANIEFVQLLPDGSLKMRVWERGAGLTLACGTGACAVAIAAMIEGHAERHCFVHLPGGPLEIQWSSEIDRVLMTGPAQAVFTGTLSEDLLNSHNSAT